jgi:hypothetical protein
MTATTTARRLLLRRLGNHRLAKTRSFIRSQKKFDGVVSQPRLR